MYLAEIRKSKGIPQKEIAERLRIGTSTYCQYELGIRKVPASVAFQIAEILGVEAEDIFFPERFSLRDSMAQ